MPDQQSSTDENIKTNEADKKVKDVDEIISTENNSIDTLPINLQKKEIHEEKNSNDLLEDVKSEVEQIKNGKTEDTLFNNIPGSFQAVLYEDSSGIIDYNDNDSIIDTTLNDYNKIKRIGLGNIEFQEGCINFKTERKIFKFDFHRIADIKTGDNYISLFMKGSKVIKLFFYKDNPLLSKNLIELYKKAS